MPSIKYLRVALTTSLLSAATALLSSAQSTQPYVYKPVKIIAGGYIPGLIAHPTAPDLIYLRTDIGGVYKWNKQETRWKPLLDWHSPNQYNLNGPESVALDPTDPNRLYIAAGMYEYPNCCAMLVSDDQGKTFSTYPVSFEMGANADGRPAGERLAVNPLKPTELMMGTRFNGLMVSEDRAQTWTQVASFPVKSSPDGYGVHWVVFDPKNAGTIYVGAYTTATVYVSKDDGATWAAVAGQPKSWPAAYMAPAGTLPPAPERGLMGTDGNLYVTFDDTPGPNNINHGLVEKYTPSAGTWTDITPPNDFNESPQRGGFVGLAQEPNHPGTVAVSTMDRWYPVDDVYVTRNGGTSWLNLAAITDTSGDDGNPYGNYYFNPSVFALTPYLTFGNTSSPNSPNPSARFGWWISGVLIDPSNPDHLIFGTGATLYGTRKLSLADLGVSPTWEVEGNGIEETAVTALISPSAGAHLISGTGDVGGFVHTDFNVSPRAGMFTNPVANTTGTLDWAGQLPGFIVRTASPSNGSTPPCNFGGYSADGGTTWAPFPKCPQGVGYSYNGGSIAVDATGAVIVWTPGGGSNVTQFSLDKGNTWIAVSGLPNGANVYADKVTPDTFYSYTGGRIYRGSVDTAHNVAVFTLVGTGLPSSSGCYGSGCGMIDVNFAKADDLWLPLGSHGLFHSVDGGATWTAVANVPYANSVGVGKHAPGSKIESVFLYGEAGTNAPMAIYRSDDNGASWVQINDTDHQYGGPTLIQADPRVYGRVYLGMNGRGIIYGDIQTPRSASSATE